MIGRDALSNFQASALPYEKWKSASEANCAKSLRVQHASDDQFTKSLQGHQYTWHDNVKQYQNVHNNFLRKLDVTKQLRDLLHERISSLTDTLEEAKQSLTALQVACAAQDEPTQLCGWRLQQKARVPARERVRDAFEVALEKERDTLVEAQAKLREGCESTQVMIKKLTACRTELQEDLQEKLHSMSTDQRCAHTGHKTWPHYGRARMDRSLLVNAGSMTSGVPLMPGQPDPPAGLGNEDPNHASNVVRNLAEEEKRQADTAKRINQASDCERQSMERVEANQQLLSRTQKKCSLAQHHVEDALAQQITNTTALRTQLEKSLQDTDKKINMLLEAMHKTAANLRAHAEPGHLCNVRNKYRGERTYKEHINDPVTTAIDKQSFSLTENHAHLEKCRADEEQALRELEEAKDTLESDIRDKTKALEISIMCQSFAVLRPERLR